MDLIAFLSLLPDRLQLLPSAKGSMTALLVWTRTRGGGGRQTCEPGEGPA